MPKLRAEFPASDTRLTSCVHRFANALYLLLPGEISGEKFATPSAVGPLPDAMAGAYAIVLGGVDIDVFRNAPSPLAAVGVLVLFTFIGSVVMLNAVVAIMVRTHHFIICCAH